MWTCIVHLCEISATTLNPPGGFNLIVNTGQQVVAVRVVLTDGVSQHTEQQSMLHVGCVDTTTIKPPGTYNVVADSGVDFTLIILILMFEV